MPQRRQLGRRASDTLSGKFNDALNARTTDHGTESGAWTNFYDNTVNDTALDKSSVQSNTPLQTVNDQATNGDIYDDHLTDKYNDAGGGETDDDTFHVEDRPYASHNNQTTNTLPSDPNVNSSTSDVGSGGEDDVDDGEADETNGLLTGETDNFNDQGHSQDTAKSNAASDQGAVPSTVQNVPWLIPPVLLPWPNNPTPFGSIMAASYSGPTTTTSNANSTDTATDKAHANGTTTDTNGAVSTNESFGDTATDQFTDGFSQTTTGSYNGASGSGNFSMVVTNGDKGGETDTDNGTADGGVTSDTYNDMGGNSITQKTIMSENATSNGQDIQSSGQSATTTIATQTVTSNASGSDTTPPGGVTAPPNGGGTDANNPDVLGGFATADQKSGFTITITNSQTSTRSGTTTGGANSYLGVFSVGDTASYKATANATITSNSVIDVNQAQGIDTRGGSLGDDASEQQTSDYELNYSQTLPLIGTISGGGTSHGFHSGYNDTDGPYGSGTDTNQTGASTIITGTWWQSPGQPSSGGGTFTTGFNNKANEPAPPAPEGQPGAGAPIDPAMFTPQVGRDIGPPTQSVVGQFFKGIGQGVLNTVNGVQGIGVGLVNLGVQTSPAGVLARALGHEIPQIESPDWSRGRVIHESDGVHSWSKAIGGNAVLVMPWTKLPALASKLAGAVGFGRSAAAAEAARVSRTGAFFADSDLLLNRLGTAAESHPEEFSAIMRALNDAGVEIEYRAGTLAYSPAKGGAGKIILDSEGFSIGALRHEYQHFLDHQILNFPGIGRFYDNLALFAKLEVRGYLQEIRIARATGNGDLVYAIMQQMKSRVAELLGLP